MNDLNLILTFKLAGDASLRARAAARIRVDGMGGILVYDAETGHAERLPLDRIDSLSIDSTSKRLPAGYVH
jgi:hypothetical protein